MNRENKLAALLFGLCIDETERLIEIFDDDIKLHNIKKTEFESILLLSSIILELAKNSLPKFDTFKKSFYSHIYYAYFERNDNWFTSEEDNIIFIEFRLEFYHNEVFRKLLAYNENEHNQIPVMEYLPFTVFESPLCHEVKKSNNLSLITRFQLSLLSTYNSLTENVNATVSNIEMLDKVLTSEILNKYQNAGFQDIGFISTHYNNVLTYTNTELTISEVKIARKNIKDFLNLTGIGESNYDSILFGIIITRRLINNYKNENGRLPENAYEDQEIFYSLNQLLSGSERKFSHNEINNIFSFIKNI